MTFIDKIYDLDVRVNGVDLVADCDVDPEHGRTCTHLYLRGRNDVDLRPLVDEDELRAAVMGV